MEQKVSIFNHLQYREYPTMFYGLTLIEQDVYLKSVDYCWLVMENCGNNRTFVGITPFSSLYLNWSAGHIVLTHLRNECVNITHEFVAEINLKCCIISSSVFWTSKDFRCYCSGLWPILFLFFLLQIHISHLMIHGFQLNITVIFNEHWSLFFSFL